MEDEIEEFLIRPGHRHDHTQYVVQVFRQNEIVGYNNNFQYIILMIFKKILFFSINNSKNHNHLFCRFLLPAIR